MCVKFIFTVANYGPFAFWITSVFAINHCRLIPGDIYSNSNKIKGNIHVLSGIESGILLFPITSSTPPIVNANRLPHFHVTLAATSRLFSGVKINT